MGCKPLILPKIVTRGRRKVPANSVPAAAVIRGGRALFGITGRKGHVGGQLPPFLPVHHPTWVEAFASTGGIRHASGAIRLHRWLKPR